METQASTEREKVVGYFNQRNSCFINASMQLLLSVSRLAEMCEQATAATPFLSALQEAKTATQGTDLLRANSFMWRCVELFVGYSPRALLQHDACEFLLFFCANLDDELPKRSEQPAKVEEDEGWSEVSDGRHRTMSTQSTHLGRSVLYELLGLTVRHEYRVTGSQKVIRVTQEELVTCIDVCETLEKGFEELLTDSAVEDYKDEGVTVRCTRSGKVENFSPYLLVSLKRFKNRANETTKIDSYVAFPQRFQVPARLLTPTLALMVSNGQISPPKYLLAGFIVHLGRSLTQGHYTAVIRSRERWLSIDDTRVQPVSPDWVRSQKAYVLLYALSLSATSSPA